ncbi:MAG: peptidoglycan-binding protein [Candidatus Sericytochromatia bacterium]
MNPPKAGKPFVPIPPQIAEAEDLLTKLQEIHAYLKSTDPEGDRTRHTAQMIQQLEAKLKQVQQRVKLHGAREPDLRAGRPPAPPPEDLRKPEAIQVLTAELMAQPGKIVKGPEVIVLQQILQFCGHAVQQTGIFDPATVAAVRAFQTRNKLPVSSRIDDKTRPLLNRLLLMLRAGLQTKSLCRDALETFCSHWQLQLAPAVDTKLERLFAQLIRIFLEPEFNQPPEPLPDPESPQPQSLQSLMSTAGQAHILSKGPEVGLLQRFLLGQGHSLTVNEIFDLQTFTALKAFQAAENLPVSGETDMTTRERINQALAHAHAREQFRYELSARVAEYARRTGAGLNTAGLQALERLLDLTIYLIQNPQAASWPGVDPEQLLQRELGPAGSGQRISHGPEVLLLQELLAALCFVLEPSEMYDPATAKAVRSFQGQKKLPLSGLVDARTLQALNAELLRLRQQG